MQVTAVMLVLNEIFYIKASILNILNRVDEILIMDNGSSDGTREWLDEMSRKHKKIKVIDGDQPVKEYYHPSWNDSEQYNRLIDIANNDWVILRSADTCISDNASIRDICSFLSRNGYVGATLNRITPISATKYAAGWWPDTQAVIFNKNACGGIRVDKNVNRHGTIKTDMGYGVQPQPLYRIQEYPIIYHYHHGFGPKKTKLAQHNRIEPIPAKYRNHPVHAKQYILNGKEDTYSIVFTNKWYCGG